MGQDHDAATPSRRRGYLPGLCERQTGAWVWGAGLGLGRGIRWYLQHWSGMEYLGIQSRYHGRIFRCRCTCRHDKRVLATRQITYCSTYDLSQDCESTCLRTCHWTCHWIHRTTFNDITVSIRVPETQRTRDLCLLTARATRPRKSHAYVPAKLYWVLIGSDQDPSVVNGDRARRRRRLTYSSAGFVSRMVN